MFGPPFCSMYRVYVPIRQYINSIHSERTKALERFST